MKSKILTWDQIAPGVQIKIEAEPFRRQFQLVWETHKIRTMAMVPLAEGPITAEDVLHLCNSRLEQFKIDGLEEGNIILHKGLPDQDKLKRLLKLKVFW